MIRLQDIDLNLLIVFQLMYQERKTGLVAERLDLSQSAVSNALGRLRKTFNDELFERTARGMRPTPFADSICEPIDYALSTLLDGLNNLERFDPIKSDRSFTISMTDLGEMYLLPPIMRHLAEHAPNVTLTTTHGNENSLKEKMESGEVNLAVGLLPQLVAGFYQRRLFDQKYVCLMREGNHILKNGEFNLEAFSQAKHIVVEAEGTGHRRVEKLFAQSGIFRDIYLRLPYFMSAPYIVSETDLIVTVPEKLALQVSKRLGLVTLPHPVNIPPAQINVFWHRRFHQDAGNVWLRNLVFDLFSE